MTHSLFPERIETDRLVFERMSHDSVDPFEFHEFVSQAEWQAATEHMPWFRLERPDQVMEFVDIVEQQWADRERARYVLRSVEDDDAIVGTTAFVPEWEKRSAGSDIVLSQEYWGRGYGSERGSVFVELTFEQYGLDAYCTSCAADNEPSRRMIEKLVERYGGRYDGLMRQYGSPRPDGEVTDQHRYSIVREEYEEAKEELDVLDFEMQW